MGRHTEAGVRKPQQPTSKDEADRTNQSDEIPASEGTTGANSAQETRRRKRAVLSALQNPGKLVLKRPGT
jgi:hypothetical protein